MFLNGTFFVKNNSLNGNEIPNDISNCHEFCTFLVTQQNITDVQIENDQLILGQGECLGLKETCVNILSSAHLTIIWLTFLRIP